MTECHNLAIVYFICAITCCSFPLCTTSPVVYFICHGHIPVVYFICAIPVA